MAIQIETKKSEADGVYWCEIWGSAGLIHETTLADHAEDAEDDARLWISEHLGAKNESLAVNI